jgi:hypothetical protein
MVMLRNRLEAIRKAWNSFEIPFWIFVFTLFRVALAGAALVIAFLLPVVVVVGHFVKK